MCVNRMGLYELLLLCEALGAGPQMSVFTGYCKLRLGLNFASVSADIPSLPACRHGRPLHPHLRGIPVVAGRAGHDRVRDRRREHALRQEARGCWARRAVQARAGGGRTQQHASTCALGLQTFYLCLCAFAKGSSGADASVLLPRLTLAMRRGTRRSCSPVRTATRRTIGSSPQ